MDVEDYIVTNVLASSGIDDEHKKDIRDTYGRVRKLFVNALTNHKLDNIFLTRDAENYSRAFGLSNTAPIHSAGADFQGNNLWADIYNKTIQNAGLTDEERSFLYCLRYMMLVESIFSQIVDKICYLLAWRINPPDSILGEKGHCCKHVDTVDTISRRCPLATKLEFLAGNGFKDIAEACDVELRNAAAHATAIIGKPTMKSIHRDTETSHEMRNEFSIEGADTHIKRRAKDGAGRWEKVDMGKAGHRLEMVVWRYNVVFSLRHLAHEFAADLQFLHAMNNPDDPHYRITFSKGRISFIYKKTPTSAVSEAASAY